MQDFVIAARHCLRCATALARASKFESTSSRNGMTRSCTRTTETAPPSSTITPGTHVWSGRKQSAPQRALPTLSST